MLQTIRHLLKNTRHISLSKLNIYWYVFYYSKLVSRYVVKLAYFKSSPIRVFLIVKGVKFR